MKPMRVGAYLILLSVAVCLGSWGLAQLAGRVFFLVFASPVMLSLGVGMLAFPGNVEHTGEQISLVPDWERLWTQTHRRYRAIWLAAMTIGVALALLAFMLWLAGNPEAL